MAVDIYDSQYLLILAPSLVIALMFLFFWLFMKETSYDEVLAKQKRDLKLPPSKPDPRKKNEKKKSKKKESSSGGSGGGTGGGGESEEDLRDFDVAEGANSSTVEVEEEPVSAATPDPALPTPTPYVPVSVSPEAPAGLRERKKKEKKAAKAAAAAAAAATAAAATTTVSPSEEPEVNGSKPVSCKTEAPLAASKQSSTPSPKREVQVQIQAVQAPVQAQTPPQISGKKKEKKKQKVESADEQHTEVKVEQAPATVKKEAPIVAETKVLDGATQSVTSGKKKNSAKKQKTDHDSAASANHQTAHNDDAPSKGSGKKQKNETDKENTEVKLKELLSGLSSLALSDAEAVSVMALLREKSPNAVDAWHKSSTRPDPTAQEREKLLTTLQEEASIAKDKVKQLSQELQVEKQKTNRVESMMREQRAAMEKELGSMQVKAQGTYQELQTMQIKFQQVREQLEGQISRLQQENSILRDAVSSATNQMESKNSAELNKLRSEYAGLMKELSDSNSKLQQEEHQRKSLEVSYKQNVSQLEAQLQDAKRRWEELQNFIHSVNAEREKIQTSKQELHNQLLAVEAEMSNKNKEIQTLHSSLTEAVVSKDRLEQKVRELMEMSKHSMQDDSLQARVQELMNENKSLQLQISTQATHVSHIEELQKLLAEKELQRKSLEDSLNAERSSGASRETNMQALHNENMSLKAEIQNLQAQISDQTASQLALDQFQKSVREKEENMKTVEGLLEKGLIEVANKEEELKTARKENESLKQEIEDLKKKMDKQVSSELMVEELQSKIQEKETKLKMVEESLQAAQDSSSAREKTVEALEQQLAALQAEMEQLRQKETAEALTSSATQLQELQAQLVGKDQKIQTLQSELEARTKELSEKIQQQSHTVVPSPELLTALSEKEKQVSILQAELAELRNTVNLQRKKNDELREKNWSAMEALSATESMLQGKLSKAVKENQTALAVCQAECRDVLHRLLPHVPLPSEQNHQEWLQRFERAAGENSAPQSSPGSGDSEELAEKLKEAEETQRVLQKDCETYKKVLAETEGILQRLQNSVEQEESRWRVKLELSQAELREMSQKVAALEQEVERLTDEAELENLRREKQHLEAELERAERESATYVTEVRELKDLLTELQTRLDGSYTEAIRQNEELTLLKTQLTETLSKLEAEENERQKVAGDLYKAQQSVDLIQGELSKVTDNADDLIENSSLSSQREEIDRNEKMTAGLGQTVAELQQLLQTVSRQLTKRQEGEADKDLPKV
ncbi:kinectin isoform X3 [Pundamilia nyererei]|uniref:Kinectin isoform X3 n=1 Tax=Pundamilia nyererei TaxID=303518 RepID=A0A9Y3QT15_9CICH|nr:PREDICTED: kinectin isoform X3 [Pundamilia nyererei]